MSPRLESRARWSLRFFPEPNTVTAHGELEQYFAGLARDWEMIESRVDHFVAQGDRVVALGHCSWRSKRSGAVVSTPKADSWQFKDGKAVAYYEFFDTAQVAQAMG